MLISHLPDLSGQRKSRTGFTFIEMIVVVVILGVLAAIALPRISTVAGAQRVNQAANVVAADLELASALAAQRRVPLELRVDSTTPGYAVVMRDSARVLLRRVLGADSEWRLKGLTAVPQSVTLYPAGTLSEPMRLVLGTGAHARTVTVTRAGLVRVLP